MIGNTSEESKVKDQNVLEVLPISKSNYFPIISTLIAVFPIKLMYLNDKEQKNFDALTPFFFSRQKVTLDPKVANQWESVLHTVGDDATAIYFIPFFSRKGKSSRTIPSFVRVKIGHSTLLSKEWKYFPLRKSVHWRIRNGFLSRGTRTTAGRTFFYKHH
ncbi:hypothetical protein TNCV_1844401 [Trichonephila clavipes]|nr:hypothetical protein TNCV_1844401 [Trichonephila clavipes]